MTQPPRQTIPPEALEVIGQSAFGEQWQNPLAHALGINYRTVRRWAHGGAPAHIASELRAVLTDKAKNIRDAVRALDRAVAPQKTV